MLGISPAAVTAWRGTGCPAQVLHLQHRAVLVKFHVINGTNQFRAKSAEVMRWEMRNFQSNFITYIPSSAFVCIFPLPFVTICVSKLIQATGQGTPFELCEHRCNTE